MNQPPLIISPVEIPEQIEQVTPSSSLPEVHTNLNRDRRKKPRKSHSVATMKMATYNLITTSSLPKKSKMGENVEAKFKLQSKDKKHYRLEPHEITIIDPRGTEFKILTTVTKNIHAVRFKPQVPGTYRFHIDRDNPELYTYTKWSSSIEVAFKKHERCGSDKFNSIIQLLNGVSKARRSKVKYTFVPEAFPEHHYYLFPTYVIDFWGSIRKEFEENEISKWNHHTLLVFRNVDSLEGVSGLIQEIESKETWSKGSKDKPKVILLGWRDNTLTGGVTELFAELDSWANRFKAEYEHY